MWISKREHEYLKNEIEFWRKQAATEKNRADRLHDRMLVLQGQPAMTDLVRKEENEEEVKKQAAVDTQLRQLADIYSEAMEEHGDLELPDEFSQEVEGLIKA